MTDPKEIAKVVAAGGKFLLDAYFAVYDEKERAHPGAAPAAPSFPEVLLAAGARLPGIEDAVANLMGHQTSPPPATAVEARIQQADAAITARMAALQARVMTLESAIAGLCRLLEAAASSSAPSPATPSPAAPSSPPAPLPPDVVVLMDAREQHHSSLLAEGEAAVATLEGAVELLGTRVVALVGGGSGASA